MLTITRNKIILSKWVILLLIIFFMCILPFLLSGGWVAVVIEMMVLALAATAVNLMAGGCGRVPFGHSAFFGIGAYTFGLLLYYDLAPFWVAFILAIVVVTLAATILSWFIVKLVHIYFALFSFSFAMLVWSLASTWYSVTGGDDGLISIPIPDILYYSLNNTYYFILAIVVICLLILNLISQSPFAIALRAIRESQHRAEFIGINSKLYIIFAFIISAIFTGIAGILIVMFSHCAFPAYVSIVKGVDFLFACLLGGLYTFAGPMVGAFLWIFYNHSVSNYTEYWPLVMGCTIIFMALFFRGGVLGYIEEKYSVYKFKRGKSK